MPLPRGPARPYNAAEHAHGWAQSRARPGAPRRVKPGDLAGNPLKREKLIGSLASIRDINYLKIANLVHAVGAISRSGIAARLNLSKTTVSAVIRRMVRDDIVRERGKGESSGGRRPQMIEFNRQLRTVVGVEIGDRECMGILTDMYAQPIGDPLVRPIDERLAAGDWRGRKETLEIIGELTSTLDRSAVLGVGIGIPGIYDERTRSITVAESLGLQDFSIRELEQAIGFPVRVINRANAAALGEKWYGLGRKVRSMIFVSIGAGVGAGIIIEDRLLLGSTGSAGELGHTVVLPQGPPCRCGGSGCLESLVSTNLLLSRARELTETDAVTLPQIERAARDGDPNIRKLLDQQGEYMGLALANAVNLFDPQLLVIGGEMGTACGEFMLPAITRALRQHARYFREVEVAVSRLGHLAVPVGASASVLG